MTAKSELIRAFVGKALQMPNGDYITFMGKRFVYIAKTDGYKILKLKLKRIRDVEKQNIIKVV